MNIDLGMDESGLRQGPDDREAIQSSQDDLCVNDVLRRKCGNRRRPDVVNPQCEGTQGCLEPFRQHSKVGRPLWAPIAENDLGVELHSSILTEEVVGWTGHGSHAARDPLG